MTNRRNRRTANTTGRIKQVLEPTREEIGFLITLFNHGRFSEAETIAHKITELFPKFGFGWKVLGAVLKSVRQVEESLLPMRKAAELLPLDPQAQTNLGLTLKELERFDEAIVCYLRAIKIKPDYAEAYNTLGNILKDLRRLKEAESCYHSALAIIPNYPEAHCNLGVTLHDLGRFDEAETCYRKALALKPDYTNAYYNLGNVLKELGRVKDAEVSYLRALELNPDLAEAYNNLGNVFKELDLLDKAETCYRKALIIEPDLAVAYSNILFILNYHQVHDPLFQVEEARKFGGIIAKKVKQRFTEWRCLSQPERLRVGMVSGDLHNHPVGFFLESILKQINPSRIELVAYTTDSREDELTTRIKPYFSEWRSLVGLSDNKAANLIHSDGVHILLDLSGHTANNRLPVFAWKPAPIQATWLGYFATTGVAEMDYILGDPYIMPSDESLHFTERVWRLPESYLCFTPPDVSLEVLPLPVFASGHITFGCFNNLAKMTDEVVALWAKILHVVRSSQLFLKTKQLNDSSVCEATHKRFADYGISAERLILEGSSPRHELLAAYNRIDIALDPFPYPGGTTTAEAFWMGVPVITRKGDRFLSHIGESILHNAGLCAWVAINNDDYLAKAVMHSSNLQLLAVLRSGLRQQVLASPLFDAPRFAGNFENELWKMWEQLENGK